MPYTDDDDDASHDRDDPLESDIDSTDEWEPEDDELPQRKPAWIVLTAIVLLIISVVGIVVWW